MVLHTHTHTNKLFLLFFQEEYKSVNLFSDGSTPYKRDKVYIFVGRIK